MKLDVFLKYMETQGKVEAGSEIFRAFHELSEEARKITAKINGGYRSSAEIRKLFSKLTGKPVDGGFCLFPPFYTDCGKNISLGKNVFINSGCKFQDQGGITIGDDVLIGHNVVIATLNHDLSPENRSAMIPSRVAIGNGVWIGSNATILPGVTIGDGAVVGAGSVVTKNVPSRCIAAGNPCKVLRMLKNSAEEKKKRREACRAC